MLNPEDCRDRWDRLAADLESALGFIDTMDAVRRTSSKAA
jgi:hypothetical protein